MLTAQLVKLTTDTISAIDTENIDEFHTAAPTALATDQIRVLTPGQLQVLTTAQAAALITAQIQNLGTDQVTYLETRDLVTLATSGNALMVTAQVAEMHSTLLTKPGPHYSPENVSGAIQNWAQQTSYWNDLNEVRDYATQ